MKKPPLFSIIIPIFHNTCLSLDGLHALQQQEESNWEVIYGFDAEKLKWQYELQCPLTEEPRIKLNLDRQHKNIGELLDNCIAQAKGRFIIILHAEDALAPDVLANLAELTSTFPRYNFCYGIYRTDTEPDFTCDQITTKLPEQSTCPDPSETWYYLFKRRVINNHKLRFPPSNSPNLLTQFSLAYRQHIRSFDIDCEEHRSAFSPFAYPQAMAQEQHAKENK